jgi:hypothetical protein
VAIVAYNSTKITGGFYIGLYIFGSEDDNRLTLLLENLKRVAVFSLVAVAFDLVSTWVGLSLGLVETRALGGTVWEILIVCACSCLLASAGYLLSPATAKVCVEFGLFPALLPVFASAHNTSLILGVYHP